MSEKDCSEKGLSEYKIDLTTPEIDSGAVYRANVVKFRYTSKDGNLLVNTSGQVYCMAILNVPYLQEDISHYLSPIGSKKLYKLFLQACGVDTNQSKTPEEFNDLCIGVPLGVSLKVDDEGRINVVKLHSSVEAAL